MGEARRRATTGIQRLEQEIRRWAVLKATPRNPIVGRYKQSDKVPIRQEDMEKAREEARAAHEAKGNNPSAKGDKSNG